MHLPKKHIKRIDDFLKRMDFEFQDIRFEMVDHIATDIEQNINDLDDFFKKDGMHGKFLLYMLSKKSELETYYEKQNQKKLWLDLKSIFKGILQLILKSKIAVGFLLLFVFLKYLAEFNLSYTVIGSSFFLYLLLIFETLYFIYQYKKIGKIKMIHTYTSLIVLIFYGFGFIPNPIKIFQSENQDITVVYLRFAGIVLSVLLFMDFQTKRKNIKEKYAFLLCN